MNYPSLEQFNEALQNVSTSLVDVELRQGIIKTTGLGLPLVLSGNFALTYTITSGGRKYAVRCFHKKANQIEQRYRGIARKLRTLRSGYFVDFDYQSPGVRVNNQLFPVVKMEWAEGETVGDFLQRSYKDRAALSRLRNSLQALCIFLENAQVAHGDIQPDNVKVSPDGHSLKLIDYDGMYVEELRQYGCSELGHRNFQHPRRTSNHYDTTLDRFAFIVLDFALRALEAQPRLWDMTSSDSDSVLFRAIDFSHSSTSDILSELSSKCGFSVDVSKFAAVCQSAYEKIPSLNDFIAGRSIPPIIISIADKHQATRPSYSSFYPVLDGGEYSMCLTHVGDKVELIGRIYEVKSARTKGGMPYVFLNFGPWKGDAVKINLWSEGITVIGTLPDKTWIGKWISVVGLMEPPYRNIKYNYSHLSITITQASQLKVITDDEAKYRLNKATVQVAQTCENSRILESIVRKPLLSPPGVSTNGQLVRHNQQVLDAIMAKPPRVVTQTQTASQASTPASPSLKDNSGCLLWILIGLIIPLYLLFKK